MAMKKCNKCLMEKPLSEFHKHNQLKDGVRGTCKVCRRLEVNSDPKHKIRQQEWYQKNKHKRRAEQLMKNYGVSVIDYKSMLEEQGGLCAICKRPPENRNLSVDHCHDTNRVRGLLCGPCNQAIGLLRDNCDTLRAAITYLEVKK